MSLSIGRKPVTMVMTIKYGIIVVMCAFLFKVILRTGKNSFLNE